MNINNKTQLQQDLESIQEKIDNSENAVSIAIDRLNDAHKYFWGLPDERLQDVLQHLYDEDELDDLFINHSGYAEDLNFLAADHTEIIKRAAIGRGRDYTIENDIVAVTPPVTGEIPNEEGLSSEEII